MTPDRPNSRSHELITWTLRLFALGVVCLVPSQPAQAQEDIQRDVAQLKDRNPQVAFKAAQHLGLLGGEASEAFLDLIQTIKTAHDADLLEASTWAVGRIAEQASAKVDYSDAESVTPAVTASVRNPGNRLNFRQASAYTLGRLAGPLQKSPGLHNPAVETDAVDSLTGILKETDIVDDPQHQEFGRTAAEALGRFRSASKAAVVTISNLLTNVANRLQDPNLPAAFRRGLGNLEIGLTAALGYIGPDATDAISTLKQLLRTHDTQAQGAAAYALGNIGQAASKSAPELIDILANGDTTVRQVAAIALGRVRPQGNDARQSVAALAAAIGDPDPGVRESAATALGKFSTSDVYRAFPELLSGLTDPDANVVSSSADSLGEIARKCELESKPNRKVILPRLHEADLALKSWKPPVPSATLASDSIQDARLAIEQAIWQLDPPVLLVWFHKHPTYAVAAIAYLTWLLLIKFAILKFWPGRLIGWNEKLDGLKLDSGILPSQIAPWLTPLRIPLPYLLGIGFFRYDPKVLEAWVEDHCQVAKENFIKQSIVRARQTYVSLPVTLNDEKLSALSHLSPRNLHKTCSQGRWCIRIIGEGGSGKTTLACQMALWALSDRPEERLCRDRKAIPILIESSLDRFHQEWDFRSLIRTQVKVLTGASKTISDALLDQLLQTRRLIVLVDGASEMEEISCGEKRRTRIDGDFPACGLIVTSRTVKPFAPGVYTDISPNRINRNYLSSFMNAYLQEADLKLEDHSLFEACSRLSAMVGTERGITPLLAELYAKALIKIARQKNSLHELPNTIPETMVQYLENIGGDHPARDLSRLAKRIAWECLRKNFRPGMAAEEMIFEEQTNTREAMGAQCTAEYLEKIGLIECLPDAKIRFTFDPLAEYLAAIYVVELLGSNEMAWTQLLMDLDAAPEAPVATMGFLMALSDSIRWKSELGIPDGIAKTLDNRVHEARAIENCGCNNAASKSAKPLELTRSSGDGKVAVARAG